MRSILILVGLLALGANGQEDYTVELHAQDADGDMLQVMLSDQRQAIIVPVGRNILVSGKIQAKDRRAAGAGSSSWVREGR